MQSFVQVAEFSVDKDTIKELFDMYTPYYKDYGPRKGFNILCRDNPLFIDSLGFDVCWAIIFSDWQGNYVRTPRSRRRKSSVITEDEWSEILHRYNFRCFYCGKKVKRLSKDHVIPISKNGLDTIDNIVPACMRCNRKKGAKFVENFKEGAMLKIL